MGGRTFTGVPPQTRNPILRRSDVAGAFDRYHVATGALYQINRAWYLFYCGAMDPVQQYVSSHWDLGIADVVLPPTPGSGVTP